MAKLWNITEYSIKYVDGQPITLFPIERGLYDFNTAIRKARSICSMRELGKETVPNNITEVWRQQRVLVNVPKDNANYGKRNFVNIRKLWHRYYRILVYNHITFRYEPRTVGYMGRVSPYVKEAM